MGHTIWLGNPLSTLKKKKKTPKQKKLNILVKESAEIQVNKKSLSFMTTS